MTLPPTTQASFPTFCQIDRQIVMNSERDPLESNVCSFSNDRVRARGA